jgi:Fe-S-cluster containining protein
MASASKPPIHQLPDNVSQLQADETFCFECYPGVPCFTECCRQLELALTPYDVLRLRQELQLGSADFLEQYVVADKGAGDAFPRLYLAMQEDETARCPFVTASGCRVYNGRPAACRTYPLGRAAFFDANGNRQAFHVLIREPHCKGFQESTVFTAQDWSTDQGLDEYNNFNDEVMGLLLHERIRQGFRPDREGCDKYILALYNLDEFRNFLNNKGLAARHEELDDAGLLRYAVRWLKEELFG